MYQSIDEINALTVDDAMIELMSRRLNLSAIPVGDSFYNLLPDTGQTLYERIQVHILLVKPTLAELDAELVLYKLELIDQFNSGEAEQARRDALQARIDALADIRILVDRAGLDWPNLEKLKDHIVKENDLATLEALEALNPTLLSDIAEETIIETDKAIGKKAKDACDDCLHVVRGHNYQLNLTKQEIKDMKTTFADILDDLQDGMPTEAKLLIDAVVDVNHLVLKGKLLKTLQRHGF